MHSFKWEAGCKSHEKAHLYVALFQPSVNVPVAMQAHCTQAARVSRPGGSLLPLGPRLSPALSRGRPAFVLPRSQEDHATPGRPQVAQGPWILDTLRGLPQFLPAGAALVGASALAGLCVR